MALIQLQNATVILSGYEHGRPQEIKALDEASLTVRNGEVMGVVGPTGCGKTTLLRVVAGLEKLAGGRLLFDGQDQRDVAPRDRGLGMVFQNYALMPSWSVLDNLSFYFRLRKREAEVPLKVKEAAEILGVNLEVLLGRMPRNLSVGQQQQVAIARCLIRDPRIFLMDEPFSNLDAVQRQHARVQLKRLLQRFRVTTIYVTHDQHEAAALCDRVAVMSEGKVLQVDTYHNLLAWPANIAVAEFVAEPGTQFIPGAAMDRHFACPAFSVPLSPAIQMRTVPGQALSLRVQPRAVRLDTGDAPGQPRVETRVDWIEPLPLQRSQRVSCRSGDLLLAVEVPQEVALQVGQALRLRIDPEQVQAFDARSGVNLSLGAAP